MHKSGAEVRQLTFSGGPGEFSRVPDLSPDGQHIVFQGKRADGDGLYVMPCTGGNAVPVPGTAGAGAPAWSPDGQQIAFVREVPESRIFLVDLRSGNVRRIDGLPGPAFYPAWSPDGTRIAFVSMGELTWDIFTVDVSSGRVHQLTRAPDPKTASQGPAWSPDGTKIAFDRIQDGDFEIYVMNANGTNIVRLTHGGGVDARPAWSPDSRSLVFHSTRDRPINAAADDRRYLEIYTMRADGTGVSRLTVNEYFDAHPDWR
ncbi:MAG: DPP IV N-terminal domain-containing protein [Gemmatimonadaceae bacterium]